MTQKQRAARRRKRYEASLRDQGTTVAQDMAELQDRARLGLLRSPGIAPDKFVALVRKAMAEKRFEALLRAAGAKFGAGVSMTRSLGNFIRAVRPADQVGQFQAAFFDEVKL